MHDNFNILSYNISSVPENLFHDVNLNKMMQKSDKVRLCVTKSINDVSDVYRLDGFTGYFNHRKPNGGGMAIFVKKIVYCSRSRYIHLIYHVFSQKQQVGL